MTLYLRRLELVVGPHGAQGQSFVGFRVGFSCRHTRTPTPSSGEVTIYNLPRASIDAVASGQACILRAGYDEDAAAGLLPVVLQGDITDVETTRDGADMVTRVRVGDGERVASVAAPALAFGQGMSSADLVGAILREVTPRAGVVAADLLRRVGGDAAFAAPAGTGIVEGTFADALTAAMPPGYAVTTQDGALQLVPPDGVIDSRALMLSSDTGLIGSPKRKAERGSRDRALVEARSLLVPELRPGRVVELRSEQHAGVYVAREVEHRGDTHTDDWYTDVVLAERS